MITNTWVGLAATAFLVLAACGSDRISRPPDTDGPTLEVEFPAGYDEDGDGLVDMRLRWSDSTGVDVASLRIYMAGVSNATDLAQVWNISQIDSTGATLEETIPGVLPGGALELDIEIADKAGNITRRPRNLVLPAVSFHKSILSNRAWNGQDHGTTAIICDDHRLYVTAGQYLTVVDADSASLIAEILNPYAYDAMLGAACVDSPDMVYAAQRAQRFDRGSVAWVAAFGGGIPAASSIAASRADPNKLYIGLDGTGRIGIYDRVTEQQVSVIPGSGGWSNEENVFDLAVMPNDEKLYATRMEQGGVAVIDPNVGITKLIHVSGSWTYPGRVDDIDLALDDSRLYAAVADGELRGIAVIDTRGDEVLAVFPVPNARPEGVAISPSGRRLFVTTQDLNSPSDNYVLDSATGNILAHFPRPRVSAIRWDGGVVFHPSGKLIFATRDIHVDVYLNRE